MRRRMSLLWARVASDAFDGFDDRVTVAPLGRAPSGHAWRSPNLSPGEASNGVSGGKFYAAASASVVQVLDTGFADAHIKATNSTHASGGRLYARLQTGPAAGGNNGFLVQAGATYGLFRVVAGATTSIGSSVVAPANGDVVELVMRGNSLSVVVNGTTLIGPITDGWCLGHTRHGLAVGATTGRWDDFSVTRV